MKKPDSEKQGRSLPWFRVDVDLVDHPKVDLLAEALNDPLAGWYIIRLWAWTMRFAAHGRLAPGARLSVERACGWRATPGDLWSALLATGWLVQLDDGSVEVHDWDVYQGAAVAKAEKDANRKRAARKSGAVTADGAGTARAALAVAAGNENENENKEDLYTSPLEQPRTAEPEATDSEGAQGEALAFLRWGMSQAPEQLGSPGPAVREWARAFFRAHVHTPEDVELLRCTFQRWLVWASLEGRKPGWGLWITPTVWGPRWDDARAERAEKAQRRAS